MTLDLRNKKVYEYEKKYAYNKKTVGIISKLVIMIDQSLKQVYEISSVIKTMMCNL